LQLAKLGFNLVLVARTIHDLKTTSEEIQSLYNVQVIFIAADLTRTESIQKVILETNHLDIHLLINNCGYGSIGSFLKLPASEAEYTTRLNVLAPLQLAHAFGVKMLAKKKGGIIFVASSSGYQPVPYLATYSAAKAFVLFLGEALYAETAGSGLDILVLSPGLTNTRGVTQLKGFHLPQTLLNVTEVITQGLNELGRRPSVVVGLKNRAILLAQKLFSRTLWLKMTKQNMIKSIDSNLLK
jgi:short-subunit dehydrogenase